MKLSKIICEEIVLNPKSIAKAIVKLQKAYLVNVIPSQGTLSALYLNHCTVRYAVTFKAHDVRLLNVGDAVDFNQ